MALDEVVNAIGADQFRPGAVFRGDDGRAYALGYAGGTHATLWVRTDQLDAVGLKPPTTYDEFLAAAKAMTRDLDGDGRVDIYGIGLPGGADGATSARFISFVYQNCGDYFDKRGNLVFNKPQVLEAVKRYAALMEFSPPAAAGWSWLDGIDAYIAGKIAMHPYGGRLGVNVERAAPDVRAKSAVVRYPVGEKVNGGRGGYDYFAVFSGAKFPAEANEFMKFFYTGDRLARFLLTVPGHLLPSTKPIAQEVLKIAQPYVQKYRRDVETLFTVGEQGADPSTAMGAVDTDSCQFKPEPNPMPWAAALFERKPPIDAEMIQRIVVKKESPEEAWKWAYTEMQRAADEWKAANPGWKPATR